jgi:MFS family permease
MVVAAQNIATMLAQPFAGAWVDRSNRKNWLVAGASVIIAIATLGAVTARTTAPKPGFRL